MHCDMTDIDFEQSLVSINITAFSSSTVQCRRHDLSIPFISQHSTADINCFDDFFGFITSEIIDNLFLVDLSTGGLKGSINGLALFLLLTSK